VGDAEVHLVHRRGWVAALVATTVLGSAFPGFAAGHQPDPVMTSQSSVAGAVLPRALVTTEGWTASAHGWSTSFRSAAPPAGRTTADVRWRSSAFQVHRGSRFFWSNAVIDHQAGPLAHAELDDALRICWVRRSTCTPWSVSRPSRHLN
jgi:hypothetical protein